MNSSTDDGGPSGISGYAYALGMSFGVLVIIVIITLASYFCTRGINERQPSTPSTTNRSSSIADQDHQSIVVQVGIDESALQTYPKLLYSQAKLDLEHKGKLNDSLSSCCSICLGDYKDSDMLRLLPDCGHVFHLKCVDSWLRLNPTCPICRSSPIPTPLSTPLAEVTPLAASRH